ncbi:MAG TPA: efflux RND transporter periplasmic adaptor subunit, partial [Pinirhizobacter sp.]|uniref:efflux RND transporter periplasmic adaptor subunit n=1 Tax=Pinirhizobacter sp. TaxID=2950432 RepID=UPI002BEB43A0
MKPLPLRTSLLCFGLIALSACGKKQEAPKAPPTPEVGVVQAQLSSAPLVQNQVGRLSAFRTADVRARVPGILQKRVYNEGSDVKTGQVLFIIDPAPLQAELDQAQANLVSAQATALNNKAAADRARGLIGKNYVSRSDLDTAIANERTANAAVKQAQAAVQTARINLSYTKVESPIDGRASQQQVTEGALVGQGDTTLLTTVDQVDPLYVNFTVSIGDLATMRRAAATGGVTLRDQDKATVTITLPDGSTYDEKGTLDFSDTQVNPSTGAVSLRAIIPNKERTLLPGTYVTIAADLGEQNKVFLIPQAAVVRDTKGAYVMTVGGDGKVVRKNINAANTSGVNWIVTSGLAAGDQVIVSG